jgi:hypothetical protein
MRYYCRGGQVLAFYPDDQLVPPSAHGEGVLVVVSNAPPPRGEGIGMPPVPAIDDAVRAASIKAECGRRVAEKLSDATQKNLTAYGASLAAVPAIGGTLTQAQKDDIATLQAIFAWVGRPGGMQGKSDALIAAQENEWNEDAKWPAWNSAWDALVARF